jgi:hypothetical protein
LEEEAVAVVADAIAQLLPPTEDRADQELA